MMIFWFKFYQVFASLFTPFNGFAFFLSVKYKFFDFLYLFSNNLDFYLLE
jgi:hypothetical protein